MWVLKFRQLLDHGRSESVDGCDFVRGRLGRLARVNGILGVVVAPRRQTRESPALNLGCSRSPTASLQESRF